MRHQIEEKQQCISSFFLKKKRKLFKEQMKKFIALLTREKQLRMNEKMMTLTFFMLYTMNIKFRSNFFYTY